jgi:drug/metabolite transporter (DMT)-like permease
MNSPIDHQSSETRAQYLLAVGSPTLAGSLWGDWIPFGKLVMREMTVAENVSFRFLAAAIVLAPIVIRTWRPYRGKEIGRLLLTSAIGVPEQFLIQFQGLCLTTASNASLIVDS